MIGQGELKTLRYSRDGSYFIVVGSKKTCTFNPLTLEEILCIETLSEIVKKVELSLNRELLVEERSNGVLIHEVRTGTKIFSANCTLPNVFSITARLTSIPPMPPMAASMASTATHLDSMIRDTGN